MLQLNNLFDLFVIDKPYQLMLAAKCPRVLIDHGERESKRMRLIRRTKDIVVVVVAPLRHRKSSRAMEQLAQTIPIQCSA